jgi:hypothetical protein
MAVDLLDMIDFSNLECLNEKPQHPASNGMLHSRAAEAPTTDHRSVSLRLCSLQC